MAIITLTSDWGNKDHYSAAVKGRILSMLPNVQIVDISHGIKPFDYKQAAYVLRNSYKHFPEGSIHIFGVNTEASIDTPHTIVYANKHFFIGADTGCFCLILGDISPDKIVEITLNQDSNKYTFSSLDVFVKVACHIASGISVDELGVEKQSFKKMFFLQPTLCGDTIFGKIIYIDNYGNGISNISDEFFNASRNGRDFFIKVSDAKVHKISESYMDALEGNPVVLFNKDGFLEIAHNKDHAGNMLGLKPNVTDIRIEFI